MALILRSFRLAFCWTVLFWMASITAFSQVEKGKASYYSDSFKGRRTASGEKYDPKLYTCAHRTHPFGTHLKVTYVKTGLSVVVKVNDRGPFTKGRVVDLSRAAANDIGLIPAGVGEVTVEVVPDSLGDRLVVAADSLQVAPPKRMFTLSSRSVTPEGYGVQLSASADMAPLLVLADKLAEHSLLLQPVDAGNKTIWRLIAGPLPTQTEAENLRQKLLPDYRDCFVVKLSEL